MVKIAKGSCDLQQVFSLAKYSPSTQNSNQNKLQGLAITNSNNYPQDIHNLYP